MTKKLFNDEWKPKHDHKKIFGREPTLNYPSESSQVSKKGCLDVKNILSNKENMENLYLVSDTSRTTYNSCIRCAVIYYT